MARYEKIGAFGLTEPEVGSGASRDLTTTARRDGDSWVLTGQKKWIGNATFGDLTVIWAGMKSVGTPSGCHAAVTAAEGRVWPQWFPGAPPSNSTGEHPASCGVDFAFVGGRLCERVNISEVDFEWVPRRRRSIDVEVRALALLRMMRIYCPLGGDTPGMFVATHPRVIRGPNFRRFIGRVGLLI